MFFIHVQQFNFIVQLRKKLSYYFNDFDSKKKKKYYTLGSHDNFTLTILNLLYLIKLATLQNSLGSTVFSEISYGVQRSDFTPNASEYLADTLQYFTDSYTLLSSSRTS